jgi:spore coat protein SA
MKNIVIITDGKLPIPAVNGGAVESLIELFLQINEVENAFNIILFTKKNKKSQALSRSYSNSSFIYINTDTISYKLGKIARFFINKFPYFDVANQFIYSVLKSRSLLTNTNLILVENQPKYLLHVKKITNIPMALHLHNYFTYDGVREDFKYAKSIICVSDFIRQSVVNAGVDNKKTICIHNGIDVDRFSISNSAQFRFQYREKYKILQNEFVVMYSGRIQESKGVKILAEAFMEIEKYSNLVLIIVGSSEFKNSKLGALYNEINKISSFKNRIIFSGYVDYIDMPYIYNLADLVVVPSIYPEAFSLVALEALSSGLPVIISDSGGTQEVVNDKCGYIVKVGPNMKVDLIKNMTKIISNSELRDSMTLEAVKRAKEFSKEKYFHEMKNALSREL